MLEQNSQNFKHEFLDADMERLGNEIAEKRSMPEHKELTDKELVKQYLAPIVKNYSSGQAPALINKQTEGSENIILPDYLKDASPEIKFEVEKLIDMVFHQGLYKAVSEAKKHDALVIDAFHDALTDKLFEELKQRKIL